MTRTKTALAVADAAQRKDALAMAILHTLQPGNGRSNRCLVDELPERLQQDGVTFDAADLPDVISRLEDCGQIIRVHRQPFSVHPQYIVPNGDHPYDDTDALAGDVCASVKCHGSRFESDEELRSWRDQDGVNWTPESLSVALRQLARVGRLKRFRQDQWNSGQPLPGLYVEPRVYSE